MTPLHHDVSAIVTDNVTYNVGAFSRHWKQRSPNAQHISCIAHGLDLVGMAFQERESLFLLHEFMSKARSVLKGKKKNPAETPPPQVLFVRKGNKRVCDYGMRLSGL